MSKFLHNALQCTRHCFIHTLRHDLLLMALLICSTLIIPYDIFAQQEKVAGTKTITGVVRSAIDNGPILGAVVSEKGANNNAIVTDGNGKFTLKIKENGTLIISCVGLTTTEVKVTASNTYNVILSEDVVAVDEVVVVGYGSQRKSDLTGSVAVTKMNDLKKAPVVSFDRALAGRVAGVTVTSADDQPGGGMDIVIRGGNSLTQSNQPLYVIDGFPVSGFNSSSLNPQDIKSINILKDASATAIYGSRGANGVIIIETMDGKEGRTTISYDGYAGVSSASKTMDLMSPREFVDYQMDCDPERTTTKYLYDGKTIDDYNNAEFIDWQGQLFRTAVTHNHSISINGGGKSTKFSISGGYTSQDGIVENTGYNRANGRLYINHTFNRNFKMNVSGEYSQDKASGDLASAQTSGTQQYSSYLLYRTWGYRPVLGKDETSIDDGMIDAEAADMRFNPIMDVKNSQRDQIRKYIRSNVNLFFTLHKNLQLIIKGGIYNRTTRETAFYNENTSRGTSRLSGNTKGINGSVNFREQNSWLNENTLNYTKKWGHHAVTALVGWTIQGNTDDRWELTGEQIPIGQLGLSGLDNGLPGATIAYRSENRLMSYLGRATYSFKERYLFTGSFRADGSSKFSKENRWSYFPSGAFAWRLSEEPFMKNASAIQDAKIRVSYGLTGNDGIGDFSRYPQMGMKYDYYYPFQDKIPLPGIKNTAMGNKDLKWETTEQFDIGADISLLRGRVNLTFDWYYKKTKDLLLNADIPYTSGYVKTYKNVGSIKNQGLEFTLSTVNINKPKFKWTSDFNISFNTNEVVSLNEGQTRLLSNLNWSGTYDKAYLYLAQIGSPAAQFVGLEWQGVYNYDDFNKVGDKYVLKSDRPSNGGTRDKIQPGDIKYRDVDGDGDITTKDNVVIGRAIPIHTGGFNNNFTYDRFSLNVFFQWSYGNDIMNANRLYLEGNQENRPALNQFKSYVNRWTPENPTSNLFRVKGQGPGGFYSSRTLEDGSYLRLKTVSLSYMLPDKVAKMIGVQNLNVYVSGQNLWTWTNYTGMDPEVSVRNSALTPGFDYSAYPRSRSMVVGLKLTF